MSLMVARGWKIAGRVVGWTLLGIVSLVILALATVFIGVRTERGGRALLSLGLRIADKYLAAKITVGRLHTDLLGNLTIEDAELRDIEGQVAAHVDRLTVRFSLLPLLHHTLRVADVKIEGGRGRVRFLSDGRVNFAALLRPSQPMPPPPDASQSRFRVEIAHARVETIGRFEFPRDVELQPFQGNMVVDGAVGIGGGEVDVEAPTVSIELSEPTPAKLAAQTSLTVRDGVVTFGATHLEVDTEGAALRAFVAAPRLHGHYRVIADGKGALEALQLAVRVETPSTPVLVDGELAIAHSFGWRARVRAHDLDPERILVGVPQAMVTLDAKGHGNTSGGTLAIAHAEVDARGNRLDAKGSVEVGRALRADLEVGIAAGDLSRLHGHGVPPLAGSVTGQARVRYTPSSLRVDADLGGRDVRLPWLSVRELSLHAHTENVSGKIALALRDLRAGSLSLAYAHADAQGDKRSFWLRAGASGGEATSIDVSLRGTPRYAGGPWPVAVTAVFDVLDVDHNHERWHLHPTATLAYDGALRVNGFRFASERQSLAVDGSFDGARRVINARVEGHALDLSRLAALVMRTDRVPHSKLDLVAHVEGPLARPRGDVSLTGTVTRDPARHDLEVRARLAAHLGVERMTAKANLDTDGSKLAVDLDAPAIFELPALLRSPAKVKLALDAETKSLGHLYDLLGLAPPQRVAALGGKLALSVQLAGTGAHPELHAKLAAGEVAYASLQHNRIEVGLVYGRGRLDGSIDLDLGAAIGGIHLGSVHLGAGVPLVLTRLVAGPGSLLDRVGRNTQASVQLRVKDLALAELPLLELGLPQLVDDGRLDASADLTGSLDAPRLKASLSAKDLRRGKLDKVALAMTLDSGERLTKLDGSIDIHGSRLVTVDAHTPFDGVALMSGGDWRAAGLASALTFPGFDLKAFADWLPGCEGKITGAVKLEGALGKPTGSGHLAIDALSFGGNRFSTFTLDGTYAPSGLHAALHANEARGGSLTLDADVPLAAPSSPLSLRLTAKAFQLDYTAAEDDESGIRRVRGLLDASLTASGTLAAPLVAGSLALTKGALAISSDPREYSALELRLALDQSTITLQKLTGKLGQGTFEVTGAAKLAGYRPSVVDLAIVAKRLPVVQDPLAAAIDTSMKVHGELKDGSVTGTIRVDSGSARLPTVTNLRNLQSTGDLKDVVYIDARARAEARKKQARGEKWKVDVVALVPGPFHVRSKELQIDLKGTLEIKTIGSDVALGGSIEAMGGTITLLGQRYAVERIRVGFDGSTVIDPTLDVKITRQLASEVIYIQVNGTASNPKLQLTSTNPNWDEAQIIAVILSGDPDTKQVTDRSLDKKVAGAVSGLVVGAIKDQIAPQLPIDVIKVDVGDSGYTGVATTRLEVGKYLADNVYVSYVHQFGQLQIGTRKLNANEGDVQYRFRRNFALDFVLGDAPAGRADLVWTLRY